MNALISGDRADRGRYPLLAYVCRLGADTALVVSTKRATAPTRGSSTAILWRSNQARIISWTT